MSILAQQGKLQQIDRVEMEMHVPADSCAFWKLVKFWAIFRSLLYVLFTLLIVQLTFKSKAIYQLVLVATRNRLSAFSCFTTTLVQPRLRKKREVQRGKESQHGGKAYCVWFHKIITRVPNLRESDIWISPSQITLHFQNNNNNLSHDSNEDWIKKVIEANKSTRGLHEIYHAHNM